MPAKSKATGTTGENEEPSWAHRPTDGPDAGQIPSVTSPDEQQLDVPAAEGVLIDVDQEAMRRAADYCLKRGFRPATTDVIAYIAAHAVDTADLNVVIMEQLAQRILSAESIDDILDPFGTVKGQDLLGRSLEVVGVQFLEGEFEDSFPWYVSLQVASQDATGVRPVTVGGEKLVIQAAGIDMAGAWPQILAIRKAPKATKAGFFPLELVRPHMI